MWPGFESWRQCHMWVEFVVSSLLNCSEFSPLLKNQQFQIPIRSGTLRHVSTSSHELLSAPWVNKKQLIILQYYNVPVVCLLVCWVSPATETNFLSHCLYREKKIKSMCTQLNKWLTTEVPVKYMQRLSVYLLQSKLQVNPFTPGDVDENTFWS